MLTILLLTTFLIHASYQVDNVLKVSIYYESLCPDSIRFLTNQLYPAYYKINSSLALDFVPYGKASHTCDGDRCQFSCQHGPNECSGNKYQACGLKEHQSQDQQIEFVNCVMGASNPSAESTIANCAPKLGVPIETILECASSSKGDQILARLGDQTHAVDPKIYFIPTIVFNDSYDFDQHWGSISDFLGTACKALDNNNPGCK
ncbi:hypothetical protein FQR65_LT06095 [Abscondita terminalis]|nr:hypothetical protein FQR65_LT06095 [Abscondita terminalis]